MGRGFNPPALTVARAHVHLFHRGLMTIVKSQAGKLVGSAWTDRSSWSGPHGQTDRSSWWGPPERTDRSRTQSTQAPRGPKASRRMQMTPYHTHRVYFGVLKFVCLSVCLSTTQGLLWGSDVRCLQTTAMSRSCCQEARSKQPLGPVSQLRYASNLVCLPACLLTRQSIRPFVSVCPAVCLSVRPSICQYVCLLLCLSGVSLSMQVVVSQLVCMSVSLSVCHLLSHLHGAVDAQVAERAADDGTGEDEVVPRLLHRRVGRQLRSASGRRWVRRQQRQPPDQRAQGDRQPDSDSLLITCARNTCAYAYGCVYSPPGGGGATSQ
jgi:hypothetical protein